MRKLGQIAARLFRMYGLAFDTIDNLHTFMFVYFGKTLGFEVRSPFVHPQVCFELED